MNYFTSEVNVDEGFQRTAGIKARDDIEAILEGEDIKKIALPIPNYEREKANTLSRIKIHFLLRNIWEEQLSILNNDDTLIIQFPPVNHSIFLANVLKKTKKKHVKIVLLIHDLELFRWRLRSDASKVKRLRIKLEEESLLKLCDQMIVHNDFMRNQLVEMRYDDSKMVSLEIFDYLLADDNYSTVGKNLPIVIAGSLRRHKAGYVYQLPNNVDFNLYGVGYDGVSDDHIHYFGSFEPNDLTAAMQGSFGLVWDGPSSKTCEGVYGQYLKINNPHKTSLYLASGLPVIIWKQAALAKFVEDHHCGITVNSLDEIYDRISKLSNEEYTQLKENANVIGKKLRNGYFTKKALSQCLDK